MSFCLQDTGCLQSRRGCCANVWHMALGSLQQLQLSTKEVLHHSALLTTNTLVLQASNIRVQYLPTCNSPFYWDWLQTQVVPISLTLSASS